MARIGRPDIRWSVNELARSITKRTKACDKRLNRLISFIHHTRECKQYCHVGNTAKQCRLGLFQDSDFAGDLEDSKSTSGSTLCIFGSHTFVPISWMCKKQTAVSHSSTESEIISLNAGLRLDGILALDLCDSPRSPYLIDFSSITLFLSLNQVTLFSPLPLVEGEDALLLVLVHSLLISLLLNCLFFACGWHCSSFACGWHCSSFVLSLSASTCCGRTAGAPAPLSPPPHAARGGRSEGLNSRARLPWSSSHKTTSCNIVAKNCFLSVWSAELSRFFFFGSYTSTLW